jgi:hypothetical protein
MKGVPTAARSIFLCPAAIRGPLLPRDRNCPLSGRAKECNRGNLCTLSGPNGAQ